MSTYLEAVQAEKKYTGNVVIQIGTDYFSIREPDSGLSIAAPYRECIFSLVLNPTTIDIRKVTTTISSFSFRLLDKDGIITALVLGDAVNLIGQEVRIFLGRSDVGMDFADYFELPRTYINKCDHGDNSYNFVCTEQTERMAKPIYKFESALAVDILAGTTTWTMRDDITPFPASGFLKVENEFVSYAGKDLILNRFTGVVRGELNSTPAAHSANSNTVLVETVTDNPLTIILKLLISGGGGGPYDVLQSGLGLDASLIDVAEIEALRDDLFVGDSYTLSLYSIPSALKYLEDQLLMPNNLRFTNSRNSKVSLAILDKAVFVEEDDVIDEDTITKYPKWSIDGAKVTNSITVNWGFNEGTNRYEQKATFTDSASIAAYGASTPLVFSFKGPKVATGGATLVDDFGSKLLARLAYPTPQIDVSTQIDKSLQTIGDKAYMVSDKIPSADGTLNFASNLEIISRAINQTSGDVQFKLAFTSFTNIRSAFIAPSDLITSFISQKRINVANGRGPQYKVGWYMRLWDETAKVYKSDPPNKIVEIRLNDLGLFTQDGDTLVLEDGFNLLQDNLAPEATIVFENDWATDLSTSTYRIRFADYNEAVESQKRYGFLSLGGANFDDGKPTYKVTY